MYRDATTVARQVSNVNTPAKIKKLSSSNTSVNAGISSAHLFIAIIMGMDFGPSCVLVCG